jgi:hypothetical protein
MKLYSILHIPTGDYIYFCYIGHLSVTPGMAITKEIMDDLPCFNFYLSSAYETTSSGFIQIISDNKKWLQDITKSTKLCDHIALDLFPEKCLDDIAEDTKPTPKEFEVVEI